MISLLLSAFLFQEPPPPVKDPTVLRVPLVEKAELGGQFRVRGEYKDPVDYRLPGTNGRPATESVHDGDEVALLRVRLHLDVEILKDLKAFVQIQDSRSFGEEGSVLTDLESTDLHQGWVRMSNLFDQPLAVQVGRTELPQLGDGRIVSPLDWHNVGRTWDGVGATWTPKDLWVHGFAVILGEDATTNARDQYFYGLYASYRGVEKHEIDVYAFGRDLRTKTATGEDGKVGDITDWTLGVRVKGAAAGFDYSGEADVQTGDFANDSTQASAFAVAGGYTIDVSWKPRIGVEATRASGDDSPTDGDRGTFDPLFPFAHAYHGGYDLVGWRNVRSLMVSLRVQPLEWLTVQLDGHLFRLDERRDAWYGITGATRRDATGGTNPDIGRELDLSGKMKCNDRVDVWVGFAYFQAGDFVEQTGPSPDGLWGFGQVTVKF
jgi:hypothetical protein